MHTASWRIVDPQMRPVVKNRTERVVELLRWWPMKPGIRWVFAALELCARPFDGHKGALASIKEVLGIGACGNVVTAEFARHELEIRSERVRGLRPREATGRKWSPRGRSHIAS
jgi:hypothetical protein